MPVKIHNKEYKTVAERIIEFYAKYDSKDTGTSVHTEILKDEGSLVQVKAIISVHKADTQVLYGTGHAEEDRTKGMINKTSALENAETSAIGRALASIGLGGEEFASADELVQALSNQKKAGSQTTASKASTTVTTDSSTSSEQNASTISFGTHKGKPYNKIPLQYLEWLTGRKDTDQETMELAKAEISVRIALRDKPEWEVDEKIFNKVAKKDDKTKNAPPKKTVSQPSNNVPSLIQKDKQTINEMVDSIGKGASENKQNENNKDTDSETPLSLERERRDIANELTILSNVLGMEKFQEIKVAGVGTKGFNQCELEELRELKKAMEDSVPPKTKKAIAKQEELLNKVVDTFDGEMLTK